MDALKVPLNQPEEPPEWPWPRKPDRDRTVLCRFRQRPWFDAPHEAMLARHRGDATFHSLNGYSMRFLSGLARSATSTISRAMAESSFA